MLDRWIATVCLTLAVLLAGCGGAPQQEIEPEVVQEPALTNGGEERPAGDLRALGAGATFATLLDAARTLDQRRDQESNAGCLLRGSGRDWRLEGDLAVAVRPLPASPVDLDAVLAADRGPVNVLSRFGDYGSGDAARATFVAVTTTLPPVREPALVWAITERGVYQRSSASTGPAEPSAIEALPSLDTLEGALFVSAEAGTPLARVAQVLAAVPASLAGRVALAVMLEPGTRLPQRTEEGASGSAPETAGLCPEGLAPLPEDAPQGELRPDRIMQSLGPLRQGASICVGATSGPGAAGGRVVLAMRIGAEGRVEDACVVRDEMGDPELRACLVRAARATAFPVPSPAGSIDVQLPLALAPLAFQRQTALCP